MTLRYHSPNRITGTNADRTGGTWTNLQSPYFFFETDTLKTFYWTGSAWSEQVVTGAGGGGAPDISRFIYVAADGTGDYTTLQAAVTAQGTGKTYKLNPGIHSITTQFVNSLSDIWIDGCGVGVTKLRIDNGVGTTNAGIVFKGSTGTQRLVTVNAARGDHTLTFASGHGFVAGDWMILRRDVQIQSTGNAGQDAEIHKIKSVTSTVVTLEDFIYEAYTTAATSAAYKITWCSNITISNLTILENRTAASQTAVDEGADCLFMYCYNLLLRNVVFDSMFYCSLALQSCYNAQTENVGYETPRFINGATYWVNYGIDILNASTNITINGGWANRCRHSVTTDIIGGLTFTYGRQRNVTINGMVSYNSNTSHFDSHEGCVGLTFNGCVAIGGYHQLDGDYIYGGAHSQQTDQVKGFTARSPTTWNGCIAQNCELYAFEIAGDDVYAAGTDAVPGGDGTSLVNCQILNTQGGDATSSGGGGIWRGVRINSHRKGIRIIGCLFKNIDGLVIWINENSQSGHAPPSNITIAGNTFYSCGSDLSSTYGLIYGEAGVNDLIVKDNCFSVGTAPANAYPVKIAGTTTRFIFKDNDVTGMTNKLPQVIAASVDVCIKDNLGLNPINLLTTPINTTNNTIGLYGGTTSTIVTATDYTIVGSDVMVTCSGGTVSAILVKDGAGNTVVSGVTTLNGQFIPRGYKLRVTHTGAPTITAYAL